MPLTRADLTRLRERVGFEPSTSLAAGLERFVRRFRDWHAGVYS